MLLALDGFVFNWTGAGSISATVSISISLTVGPVGGGGGGHHRHRHNRWFKQWEGADDDYWSEREKMLRRHEPLTRKEMPEKIRKIAEIHDRLLEDAHEVSALSDLAPLSGEMSELATQISYLELQSDNEALIVLLLS